eukprot:11597325-Karenia_brevis.AAC.1
MHACHKKRCEEVGFTVHEEESAAHWAVSLGFMIDTLSGEYRCTPERMWKIRQASSGSAAALVSQGAKLNVWLVTPPSCFLYHGVS